MHNIYLVKERNNLPNSPPLTDQDQPNPFLPKPPNYHSIPLSTQTFHLLQIEINISNPTLSINRHLRTQLRTRSIGIIAQRITLGIFRREDQKLIPGDIQAELFSDVVVLAGGFVSRTTGAMEARAGVDA